MKVKTSELTGAALGYAVRYAELGRSPKDGYIDVRDNFHECWNKAGPIIEREKIGLRAPQNACRPDGTIVLHIDYWYARNIDIEGNHHFVQNGATPLIAAMRCYVASKLGDEVDIPDELLS